MFKMDSFLENKDFYRKKKKIVRHTLYISVIFTHTYIYIYKYKTIYVPSSFFYCTFSIFDTSHFSQQIATTYYNSITQFPIQNLPTTIKNPPPRIMKHIPRLQFKSEQKFHTLRFTQRYI